MVVCVCGGGGSSCGFEAQEGGDSCMHALGTVLGLCILCGWACLWMDRDPCGSASDSLGSCRYEAPTTTHSPLIPPHLSYVTVLFLLCCRHHHLPPPLQFMCQDMACPGCRGRHTTYILPK